MIWYTRLAVLLSVYMKLSCLVLDQNQPIRLHCLMHTFLVGYALRSTSNMTTVLPGICWCSVQGCCLVHASSPRSLQVTKSAGWLTNSLCKTDFLTVNFFQLILRAVKNVTEMFLVASLSFRFQQMKMNLEMKMMTMTLVRTQAKPGKKRTRKKRNLWLKRSQIT